MIVIHVITALGAMITALGIIIGGIWALIIYVNERGSVTAVELDVEHEIIGETEKQKIVEFTAVVNNKGPLILIVKELLLRLKTIRTNDIQGGLELFDSTIEKEKNKYGRLKFPNKHTQKTDSRDKFKLVPFITFVKPGVRQKYSFVTVFKKEDEFVLAQAYLEYGKGKKQWWQSHILKFCEKYGLRKHIISDIMEKPQTVEKAFNIQNRS